MMDAGRPSAARSFETLVRAEDEDLDLARAALAIAEAEYPGLDPQPFLMGLDAMAANVRRALPAGAGTRAKVETLNRYLFEELGFRGNLEEYYDPQNSHLNRVLERRVGIPITLSIVYIEVGQRLGLPVVGVGLPGHFVIKIADAHEEILLDPFYKGTILDRAECQRRLDAIYGGKVVLSEQFLRAVGKRDILARMLYNLKRIHQRSGDPHRLLATLDMILALQPYSFEDLRDRGLALYKDGRFDDALRDLRGYLQWLPQAADAAAVQRAIAACERLRTPKA